MPSLKPRRLTKPQKRARRKFYLQELSKFIDTGLSEGGKFGETAFNALGSSPGRKRR